jgi:hypothetical protein
LGPNVSLPSRLPRLLKYVSFRQFHIFDVVDRW